MRLAEIEDCLERRSCDVKVYRFSVEADDRLVIPEATMRWRVGPREALVKFAAMMKRKFPCKELKIDMDWSDK